MEEPGWLWRVQLQGLQPGMGGPLQATDHVPAPDALGSDTSYVLSAVMGRCIWQALGPCDELLQASQERHGPLNECCKTVAMAPWASRY